MNMIHGQKFADYKVFQIKMFKEKITLQSFIFSLSIYFISNEIEKLKYLPNKKRGKYIKRILPLSQF